MQPSFKPGPSKGAFILPSILDMVVLVSLMGTITGYLPISPVIVILLPVGIGMMFLSRQFPGMVLWAMAFLGAGLISAALYYPQAFLEYDFYRRDGNVFITFSPLIAIPLLRTNWGLMRHLKWWVAFAAVANAVCLFLYSRGVSFFADRYDGTYSFLFEAHNAAGGFLGMVTLAAILIAWRQKSLLFAVLSATSLAGFYLTQSRGSLLAFLFAFPLVMLNRPKFATAAIVASQIVMCAVIWHKVDYIHLTANQIDQNPAGILNTDAERSASVEDRLYRLYPMALSLWVESPFVGTGFGSYNDRPYRIEGIPKVFAINQAPYVVFRDNHAHHSFLHILAEQGLFGFGILMGLLVAIYRVCDRIQDKTGRLVLVALFWYVILCSLTEHRLVTPSQALPWLTLVGLACAWSRKQRPKPRDGAPLPPKPRDEASNGAAA